MAVQKRAISEEAKLKRREKILKTAEELFKKNEGTLPTILQIARKAGLSKGSVYLYFKSKNEILLSLYLHQIRLWDDSVARALKDINGEITAYDYARLSSQYVINNPLVLKMWSIANGLFDGSTDQKVLNDFKVQLTGLLDERCRSTIGLFPGLNTEQWLNIHLKIYALIFGLWQIFYSPNQVKKLSREPRTRTFDPDFSQNVVESVTTLLNGVLEARDERRL